MLSCSYDFEFDGDGWFWTPGEDFSTLKSSRAKRCCSCKELVKPGSQCVELDRYRWPKSEIEERIYGECADIQIASWYLCEKCGEQFLNLTDLGYCYNIGENVMDMLKEYQLETGFDPDRVPGFAA